jgi:hypothetical protein
MVMSFFATCPTISIAHQSLISDLEQLSIAEQVARPGSIMVTSKHKIKQ